QVLSSANLSRRHLLARPGRTLRSIAPIRSNVGLERPSHEMSLLLGMHVGDQPLEVIKATKRSQVWVARQALAVGCIREMAGRKSVGQPVERSGCVGLAERIALGWGQFSIGQSRRSRKRVDAGKIIKKRAILLSAAGQRVRFRRGCRVASQ